MTDERRHYDPALIMDAEEFHELGRAMGALTWSTWDHQVRSFQVRREDFVASYPPDDPCRFSGATTPSAHAQRLERFRVGDWRPGSLYELLSRYGLCYEGAPSKPTSRFEPAGPLREVARRRNRKLRLLHGTVDLEAKDMTAAKAERLEKEERKQAAEEIRAARKRMRAELTDIDGND